MAADDRAATSNWTAAIELAAMPGVWRPLLEVHVPDPSGRCRGCTQGGTGIPAGRWPCGPRKLAEAAAHLHGRRRATG
jgi:hypothetical protein